MHNAQGSMHNAHRYALVGALLACAASLTFAQAPRQTAWFGVPLPMAPGHEPAVIVGDRGVRPAVVPAGEERHTELAGAAIRADVDTIVGFSKESRATREIGAGQLWGRIAGFPSATKTVAWAAEQFRKAGIADVRVQSFGQDERASLWLPLSWDVRLLGDPAFGAGTADLVLQSAMPLQPSELPGGTLTAPLVYVGAASPAVTRHIDVKGKIAVQLIVPQGHMVFERATAVGRAQDLMKRGAVAVLNIVRLPGNELARDFANCGGPCFNIGGRDGAFLESVFDKAAAAGQHDTIRARLTLRADTRANLKAENAVAIVRGNRSDEAIIVNAHADAWFDGAGDNADGLAVTIALARHFAKPENAPQRTLLFTATAGHHTPGLNGPRNVLALNPEIAAKTVLMLNIEHVAQRNFSPARSVADDGVREAVADSGEAPIVAGVSNGAPFLDALFQQGVSRYGVNFVSDRSTMESGETGGYQTLKVARLTIMQAPPLYHTTGEVADVISTPGLERIARFFAFFLKEVDKAEVRQINP
jgi:hypothetical protein